MLLSLHLNHSISFNALIVVTDSLSNIERDDKTIYLQF